MAEIVVVPSQDEAGTLAAEIIFGLIRRKPDAVLGLATGSTPLVAYRALSNKLASHPLDVSHLRGFSLDEYVGLPDRHPQSYRTVITREVVEPLGLTPSLIHVPNAAEQTIQKACADYERAIEDSGGVDLQLLGIGTNGHIGFNEPGSSFGSVTRIKTLTEETRRANARFFANENEVPRHCITQGMSTILRARHLMLLAFGERKADALAGAVEGPVSTANPGSAIQLHPHVTVLVDEAAASKLKDIDYYRQAYVHKPAWQEF